MTIKTAAVVLPLNESLSCARNWKVFCRHDLFDPHYSQVALVVKNLTCLPMQKEETGVRSSGQEDPWKRAWEPTPGSIHAWRIPWTEKPDKLQFMGSQRVRHNWSNLARMHELYEESNSASFLKMRKLKIGKVKYPFEDHTRDSTGYLRNYRHKLKSSKL